MENIRIKAEFVSIRNHLIYKVEIFALVSFSCELIRTRIEFSSIKSRIPQNFCSYEPLKMYFVALSLFHVFSAILSDARPTLRCSC